MAPKKTTLKEVGDMLSHVVEHMATKTDVREIVAEELAPIKDELKQVARDLEKLKDDVQNIFGYRKEIDHAFERIAAIEKHLGLKPKHA
jgi:hypothetical protein